MKTPSTETKIKTMRLSTEVINKIERMARDENRNFTNMVETILKKASTQTMSL